MTPHLTCRRRLIILLDADDLLGSAFDIARPSPPPIEQLLTRLHQQSRHSGAGPTYRTSIAAFGYNILHLPQLS